ncbi:MAG TPA: hypothetical protein VNN08_20460 [Thermoanaerobaculia bacterium]|nr:hypothetical protein [Thermoanaerobaculia bacterium]
MRSIANIFTVAVMLSTTAALSQQPDINSRINSLEVAVNSGAATPAQQLDLARLYIQENRFYEANRLAAAVLGKEPDNADAKALNDQSARGLHEVQDRAVADAEARANRSGATDQDRLALANAYFDAGSYGAAATTYARVPPALRDRDTRLRYARALAWSSRFDDAELVYSNLLKEQSTPDLELEYGRLLSWMGAQSLSVTTLTELYNKNQTEDAAVALANARAWNGDREGALRLLDDYVQAHPNAAQARQLSSDLRASPELRIERVSRMIEQAPYNLALRVERARLYAEAGRDGEALADVSFARDHAHGKITALDEIEARVRQHRKEVQATLEPRRLALDAQQSMASSSPNPDEILALAKAYAGIEDYGPAVRLFQRYLALRPDDTAARIQYARVLSWDRRWGASERQYEILIERNPDRSDLRYEYAQVLSYDSQFVPAIHVFRSLTDLSENPRSRLYTDVPPKAYFNIGQIHRWYGWNETAAAEENRALALDPGYVPAREELDLDRHARPTSTADARFSYATDSDDFTLKRVDLTAEKWTSGRTAFDLGVGRHEFSHLGDDVYANEINAGGSYRASDRWTLRGNVGLNLYDHGLGTRPFLGIGTTWQTSLQSRAALDVNHYDLVYDVFTLQSLTIPAGTTGLSFASPLSINDVRGHYDYATGGHWAFLGDASYGFISDSNRRTGAHGLLSFQILKAPFLAVKLDGRTLSYDFRSNRYWSPSDYRSIAGVVQLGQNLRNGLHWDVEVKAGKAYEGSLNSDLRAYEGNVAIPLNDAFDLIGNYGYGKSGRLGDVLSGGGSNELVNYWQRHWLVGVRVKQLYSRGDRKRGNAYYFDNRVLTESPIVPPETH